MGSVAMIVGRTPQVRCNDLGHSLPFIAIRRADDCGSLQLVLAGFETPPDQKSFQMLSIWDRISPVSIFYPSE